MNDLESIVGNGERIIWKGKPNKKVFILESIFNPLMPFALIWFILDSILIGLFSKIETGPASTFVSAFFLLHLMPVWIYLAGIIFSFIRYKNTSYLITDAAVYASSGTFSYSYNMKPFTELSNISMHQGFIDRYLNVGDVIFDEATFVSESSTTSKRFGIYDIADYIEVYKMVKDMQRDIYADTMYPNDLRPKENHGYNTEYKN